MFVSPRFRDIFGADPIKTRRTDQEVALDRPDSGLADEPEKEPANADSPQSLRLRTEDIAPPGKSSMEDQQHDLFSQPREVTFLSV